VKTALFEIDYRIFHKKSLQRNFSQHSQNWRFSINKIIGRPESSPTIRPKTQMNSLDLQGYLGMGPANALPD
jgi:hypothetical protein